jgi:hypothetical protein
MKKEHISCKKIANYICGELDEHIDSPRCREIKKHLKTCPNCTAYLDGLKKTVSLYRQYPNPIIKDRCRKELFDALKLGDQKSKETFKPLSRLEIIKLRKRNH